ncbi:MAG: XRE family transcriptional regulator [Rhizobiaceae bacterium]
MATSSRKAMMSDVQAETLAHAGFAEAAGHYDQEQLAARFGVTKRDIAETAGLSASATYRKSRMASASAQARLMEMSEILRRVTDWAGGGRQAFAWYRAEPIPAFGNRTAESIVKGGQATALRDYLDHLALGGFA